MSFHNCLIYKGNIADYHTENKPRGDAGFVVSSSMLRLFAQCPARWREGYVSPESEAKRFGSLLDCCLLTPESFQARFAVKPATYKDAKTGGQKPWNGNSNACKEWLAAHAKMEIVSSAEVNEVDAAIERIKSDPILAAFLSDSTSQVWLTGEWHDEKTGLDIPIKALLDIVPRAGTEFEKSLADLKCVRSGALQPFTRQVYQLGWHIQAAFYRDFYAATTGEDRPNWCFIGVENYPPFQPFRRLLSEKYLEIGKLTYQNVLSLYARCLKAGNWPGYDDHADACQGWTLCEPDAWMEYNALSFQLEQQFVSELSEETNDIPS